MSNYRLIEVVVSQSEADTWNEARKEWCIADCHDNGCDHDAQWGDCICGHHNIRFEYRIKNVLNGNIIEPVGSKCINLFQNQDMDDEIKNFESEAKLNDKLTNFAACLMRAEPVEFKDYTVKLLKHLSNIDEDYFYSENEKQFILKMRRMKNEPTPAQRKWIQDWLKRANGLTEYKFGKDGEQDD